MSRRVGRAGVIAATAGVLMVGPVGVASAAPTPVGISTPTSTPTASRESMAGMDDGSMPGMPGMTHGHDEVVPATRPVAWVVGAFVVVNGAVMGAAAVLRRRRPGGRRRVIPVTLSRKAV